MNEPYVTGGNPILSSKDGVMFNDMLDNTLNIDGKAAFMTAFGETEDESAMFTGKPYVGKLGYAFLFRNYRADQGKWNSADPLGYPDGWNNLAYCNNWMTCAYDNIGAWLGIDDCVAMLTGSISGQGSITAVSKQMMTKLKTGTIQNMKNTTQIKTLIGNIIGNVPDSILDAIYRPLLNLSQNVQE